MFMTQYLMFFCFVVVVFILTSINRGQSGAGEEAGGGGVGGVRSNSPSIDRSVSHKPPDLLHAFCFN